MTQGQPFITVRQVDARDEQALVADYKSGSKIAAIEKKYGVSRTMIYWVLNKHGELPDRVHMRTRMAGSDKALAEMYELLEAAGKTIAALEAENARLQTALDAKGG